MQHSLFWLLDYYPELGESLASLYEAALDQAAEADRLGFTSLWLAEHHFCNIGTVPNPAVLLAAIAQRTQAIRLGPATAVLPLRHPIHVAEDYSLVDVLSGGRLNMGVGSGSQQTEYAPFGIDFEHRREAFDSHLADIRERWEAAGRGETGSTSVNVAPIQSPAPPVYIATMNEESAYQIGLAGTSMLTLVPPSAESLDEVVARVRSHERGLKEAGQGEGPAESIVMTFAYVAETEAEVKETVVPALSRLMLNMAGTELPDAEAFYEQARQNSACLFGTSADARRQLQRMVDLGIDHVAFISRFGGIPREEAARSLRKLSPQSPDFNL